MVETNLRDGVYRIDFESVLDAPPAAVAAVLTDYPGYLRLDPRISSSDVVETTQNGVVVLRTRVRICAGFLCRNVERVERVTRHGDELVAEIVPANSDFRRGVTTTRWLATRGRTRVRYAAEFEPDFWVPGVVGRRLALEELRQSTLQLFANVERRARQL